MASTYELIELNNHAHNPDQYFRGIKISYLYEDEDIWYYMDDIPMYVAQLQLPDGDSWWIIPRQATNDYKIEPIGPFVDHLEAETMLRLQASSIKNYREC